MNSINCPKCKCRRLYILIVSYSNVCWDDINLTSSWRSSGINGIISFASINRNPPSTLAHWPPIGTQNWLQIFYCKMHELSILMIWHVVQQMFFELQVIDCSSLQASHEKLNSVTKVCRCQWFMTTWQPLEVNSSFCSKIAVLSLFLSHNTGKQPDFC